MLPTHNLNRYRNLAPVLRFQLLYRDTQFIRSHRGLHNIVFTGGHDLWTIRSFLFSIYEGLFSLWYYSPDSRRSFLDHELYFTPWSWETNPTTSSFLGIASESFINGISYLIAHSTLSTEAIIMYPKSHYIPYRFFILNVVFFFYATPLKY